MAGQSTLQVGDMMTDIGRVKRMFEELKKLNPEKFSGGNDQLSAIIKELIPYGHNYDDTAQRVETYVKLCYSVYGNPFANGNKEKELVCYTCGANVLNPGTGCKGGDMQGQQMSQNHTFVPAKVRDQVIHERKEVERLRSSIEMKRTQISDLTNRLSAEMNAKMSSDERNIENINVKIRPSTLQTKYQNLCTQEWLGAKEALDDKPVQPDEEEPKLFLLFRVLKESETITARLVDSFTEKVTGMILNPCASTGPTPGQSTRGGAGGSGELRPYKASAPGANIGSGELRPSTKGSAADKNPLNNESMNALNQLLRAVSDDVNLKSLERETKEALKNPNPKAEYNLYELFTYAKESINIFKTCEGSEELNKYISECVRLTWMMALQKPKMQFHQDGIGEKYNDKLQEVQWGSQADPKKGLVGFFVHPVLYHGDKASSKGKVFLVDKSVFKK